MPSSECFVEKERRKNMMADTLGIYICICGSGYLTVHSCLVFVVCGG